MCATFANAASLDSMIGFKKTIFSIAIIATISILQPALATSVKPIDKPEIAAIVDGAVIYESDIHLVQKVFINLNWCTEMADYTCQRETVLRRVIERAVMKKQFANPHLIATLKAMPEWDRMDQILPTQNALYNAYVLSKATIVPADFEAEIEAKYQAKLKELEGEMDYGVSRTTFFSEQAAKAAIMRMRAQAKGDYSDYENTNPLTDDSNAMVSEEYLSIKKSDIASYNDAFFKALDSLEEGQIVGPFQAKQKKGNTKSVLWDIFTISSISEVEKPTLEEVKSDFLIHSRQAQNPFKAWLNNAKIQYAANEGDALVEITWEALNGEFGEETIE